MSSPEAKLLSFVVRFFNPVNNNLHSSTLVEVEHVKDAVETAIKVIADTYKEDVRSHNAAITTPNGEGVQGTDNVATVNQLQNQLAEIQRQLDQHNQDNASGTPTTPPAPLNADVVPDPANRPDTSNVEPGQSVSPPSPSAPFSASDVDSAIPPV